MHSCLVGFGADEFSKSHGELTPFFVRFDKSKLTS